MKLLGYGPDAVLVELPTDVDVHAYAEAAAALAGVREVVPGARTVQVRADAAVLTRLRAQLAELPTAPVLHGVGELITLPVVYDGADLTAVAELCGLSVEAVVARHCAPDYRVAFCGFAPGFAYLDGLDPTLRVPRLETPRTRGPAGAVAIADVYSAVYPRSSPGGWRLLGRCAEPLWNSAATPPARLTPGRRVRFVPR